MSNIERYERVPSNKHNARSTTVEETVIKGLDDKKLMLF